MWSGVDRYIAGKLVRDDPCAAAGDRDPDRRFEGYDGFALVLVDG